MNKIFIILFLSLNIFARDFSLVSYNVENFFDLNYDKTEYKEYIQKKSNWNEKNFQKKLNNIVKVLKDINADIYALQEVENQSLLKLLQKKLPEYKYISFAKNKKSATGLGFLSKIKIINTKIINIDFKYKLFRPIIRSDFEFENNKFSIYNNHWPSKRNPESYRVKYALALKDEISKLEKTYDYILLGDFNTNYNESKYLYLNKKLNNTQGLSGINNVLNTTLNNNFIKKETIINNKKVVHYNLYLELKQKDRFSAFYRNEKMTPDNILLPKALFDNKNISYINNSFKIIKYPYLISNNQINRWKIKNNQHLSNGFSDHLPIFAKFSTNEFIHEKNDIQSKNIYKINDLYKFNFEEKNFLLNSIHVIYKHKNSCIIKQNKQRAIFIYKNCKNLEEGFVYDIKVENHSSFYGLKQILSIKKLRKKFFNKDYKNLYIKTSNPFLVNENEIIKDFSGVYKNSYIYFDDKKIKIYSKDKSLLPNNNKNITIIRAHLALYKSKKQIILYKKSDYKEH